MDLGLFLIRSVVGAALAAQGVAKLRRDGRAGTTAFFEAEGFLPPRPAAWLAGASELGAGILLVVGLGTPLAAAAGTGVLSSAIAVTRRHGWFATKGGAEYPTVLAAAIAGLAFTGPGRVSLDAGLGLDRSGIAWGVGAIAAGVLASAPVLVRRAIVLDGRARAATPLAMAALDEAA